MIQFLTNALDFIRPLLFVLLLLYLPLKTGFLFDVLIKPINTAEMRSSRRQLVGRLMIQNSTDLALFPFRLLLIVYISLWLLIDRHPLWWIVIFLVTFIPVFSS